MNKNIPLGNRQIFHTTDLDVATILATKGVRFVEGNAAIIIENDDGSRCTQFNMEATTADGVHKTRDLAERIINPAYAEANGESDIAYMKYALMNRKRLVDAAKSATPFASVKRVVGGKTLTYLVRKDGETHRALKEIGK